MNDILHEQIELIVYYFSRYDQPKYDSSWYWEIDRWYFYVMEKKCKPCFDDWIYSIYNDSDEHYFDL